MPRSLDLEIREHLADYLAGMMSLRDFEDWFFSATTDVHQSGDHALEDLVYTIKLDWAEYTEGDKTEDDLRRALRPLVTSPTASFGQPTPDPHTVASSGSTNLSHEWSLGELGAFSTWTVPPPPPAMAPAYPTFGAPATSRAS